MKDKCPMCGSTDHKDISVGDIYKGIGTEIHACQPCPCVWFEFHNQRNWMDVGEALELGQVEQI